MIILKEEFLKQKVILHKKLEAIRPTNFSLDNAGKTDTEKLYNLIWRRTFSNE